MGNYFHFGFRKLIAAISLLKNGGFNLGRSKTISPVFLSFQNASMGKLLKMLSLSQSESKRVKLLMSKILVHFLQNCMTIIWKSLLFFVIKYDGPFKL